MPAILTHHSETNRVSDSFGVLDLNAESSVEAGNLHEESVRV